MEKRGTLKSHGVIIIELTIIIVVLSILIISIRSFYNSGVNLYEQAYQLASYIRTTQQNAISLQTPMRIMLRSDGYQIYHTDDLSNQTTASANTLYSPGVSQCNCSANPGGTCYIKYDAIGMPYAANDSGSFAALTSNFIVTLCASGASETRDITVNTAGGVTVQ